MKIGPFTHEEFMEEARKFHGYPAPGLILGGYMVELARSHMPRGVLYDAVSETVQCLPDAIQMLTPCTFGNGWLRVLNMGLYGMSLYDKAEGKGVRVWLDVDKMDPYPAIREWFLKLKPKREQDSDQLQEEIYEAGIAVLSAQPIAIKAEFLHRSKKGAIVRCAICGEPHPAAFGKVCRSCQGESPYLSGPGISYARQPSLSAIPAEQAVGRAVLHDMTSIEPGLSKGAAFRAGHILSGGDLCRLQLMGKHSVYVDDGKSGNPDFVHENAAAASFARLMPGEGVAADETIREGKINFRASRPGLLLVEVERLRRFNRVPDVICATRHNGSVVDQGMIVAGSRAIPLYLPKVDFLRAENELGEPLFSVLPLRKARIGVLVTGTEVFQGLIEDRFEPVIRQKAESLSCEVVQVLKAPDEAAAIRDAVHALLRAGADLIVTTAGMSVDPDDVTRKGLREAGLDPSALYGVPILPGSMSLLGDIARNSPDRGQEQAQVMGVPACALYHKTTAFDALLPYVLARAPITREFLDDMGHGGLCLDCKTCTWPKCSFAK